MSNKILSNFEIENIKLRLNTKEKVELTRDEALALLDHYEYSKLKMRVKKLEATRYGT